MLIPPLPAVYLYSAQSFLHLFRSVVLTHHTASRRASGAVRKGPEAGRRGLGRQLAVLTEAAAKNSMHSFVLSPMKSLRASQR